eukprot:CAMPEP_0174836754 /NCGR_PEP_ID=MMETSP1114-20130205/6279_1 /TAXON_ID=312471 /ORGANISM="Neobodo designis, Strain CCAP 1951/1" /LENGTH=148 /DNA_ID=CAMNT_0016070763 /DNA_START=59 /DNA_END=505 /DNA_ORIENTATION=-
MNPPHVAAFLGEEAQQRLAIEQAFTSSLRDLAEITAFDKIRLLMTAVDGASLEQVFLAHQSLNAHLAAHAALGGGSTTEDATNFVTPPARAPAAAGAPSTQPRALQRNASPASAASTTGSLPSLTAAELAELAADLAASPLWRNDADA